MPPAKGKAHSKPTPVVALEEETSTGNPPSVEQMLEAKEDEIAREDAEEAARSKAGPDLESELEEGLGPEDKTQESHQEAKPKLSEADYRQLLSLSQAQEKIANLEAKLARLEGYEPVDVSEDEEEDIPYDIGELEDGYEPLRPALERIGKAQQREILALKREFLGLREDVAKARDEAAAEWVRDKFKVEPQEETRIVEWCKERGIAYENAGQLAKVVEDYRDLQTYRSSKSKNGRTERPAPPRTRSQGSETFDEDRVRKPGRRSYEQSFEFARRKTLEGVRSGRIPLT